MPRWVINESRRSPRAGQPASTRTVSGPRPSVGALVRDVPAVRAGPFAVEDDDAFGDHPFTRFGVETDDRLRPLDARGEPVFDNLRAAGAVLGGYDFAAEKSGSGVSIATGYAAGRAAAEVVV